MSMTKGCKDIQTIKLKKLLTFKFLRKANKIQKKESEKLNIFFANNKVFESLEQNQIFKPQYL